MSLYHPRDDVPIVHTAQDKLNRGRLAARLAEAIQTAPLPQVMGVEGDWGSGKTSLLQNLFWRIEKKVPRQTATISGASSALIPQRKPLQSSQWKKFFSRKEDGASEDSLADENIRAVWFEAWRYQHEPEPIIALLHEIRAQLLTGDKWEQRARRLWEKMKQGAEVFVQGLVASTNEVISSIEVEAEVPFAAKLSAKMPDVGKHVKAASKSRQARLMGEPLKSEMLHKNLDLAISLFLGDETVENKADNSRRRRLVIIIDDLDRCASEAVCRLLESIKIHLDLPSCFFVLGLNRRHVETSLTLKLVDAFHVAESPSKELLLRARASDYVEKICTNLVRIPRPDPDCCVALAKQCIAGLDWPVEWKEATPTLLDAAFEKMLRAGHFIPLPSNPRRIKALCNQFQLTLLNASVWLDGKSDGMTSLAAEAKLEVELRHLRSLFILAALRQFFADVYRMIEAAPRFYNALREWCANPRGTSPESEAKSVLGALHPITNSVAADPVDAIMDGPGALLPDPHEGIAFFIQELVVHRGDLTEDEVTELIRAI